jgi:hypothetical protein
VSDSSTGRELSTIPGPVSSSPTSHRSLHSTSPSIGAIVLDSCLPCPYTSTPSSRAPVLYAPAPSCVLPRAVSVVTSQPWRKITRSERRPSNGHQAAISRARISSSLNGVLVFGPCMIRMLSKSVHGHRDRSIDRSCITPARIRQRHREAIDGSMATVSENTHIDVNVPSARSDTVSKK